MLRLSGQSRATRRRSLESTTLIEKADQPHATKTPSAPRRRPSYRLRKHLGMRWRRTARPGTVAKSWMVEARDLCPGQQMVEIAKPFLRHLLSSTCRPRPCASTALNLWPARRRNHLGPAREPPARSRSRRVALAALNDEGGPLISNRASEEQQRSFDSTCRKLHRFLKERWVLRLTGCGHVDNASALPTGSTARNRHRSLSPHQFEKRSQQPRRFRSHAVPNCNRETPTRFLRGGNKQDHSSRM